MKYLRSIIFVIVALVLIGGVVFYFKSTRNEKNSLSNQNQNGTIPSSDSKVVSNNKNLGTSVTKQTYENRAFIALIKGDTSAAQRRTKTTIMRLTPGGALEDLMPLEASELFVSPAHRYVGYVTTNPEGSGKVMNVIDVASKETRQLYSIPAQSIIGRISWSLDESHIGYVLTNRIGHEEQLGIIDIKTGTSTFVKNPYNPETTTFTHVDAYWLSYDGSLAFINHNEQNRTLNESLALFDATKNTTQNLRDGYVELDALDFNGHAFIKDIHKPNVWIRYTIATGQRETFSRQPASWPPTFWNGMPSVAAKIFTGYCDSSLKSLCFFNDKGTAAYPPFPMSSIPTNSQEIATGNSYFLDTTGTSLYVQQNSFSKNSGPKIQHQTLWHIPLNNPVPNRIATWDTQAF